MNRDVKKFVSGWRWDPFDLHPRELPRGYPLGFSGETLACLATAMFLMGCKASIVSKTTQLACSLDIARGNSVRMLEREATKIFTSLLIAIQ
ncbi:MAG: hypothetical protein AAB581_03100 [Patescibacteria group bacterium]